MLSSVIEKLIPTNLNKRDQNKLRQNICTSYSNTQPFFIELVVCFSSLTFLLECFLTNLTSWSQPFFFFFFEGSWSQLSEKDILLLNATHPGTHESQHVQTLYQMESLLQLYVFHFTHLYLAPVGDNHIDTNSGDLAMEMLGDLCFTSYDNDTMARGHRSHGCDCR